MSVPHLDTTDQPDSATASTNRLSLDDRTCRALLEAQSVEALAPGMYLVYSENGTEYVVDIDGGACTCPDFRYRNVECKHLRRARLEAGDADTAALAERVDAGIEAIDNRLEALATQRAALVRLKGALDRFDRQ